MIANKVDFAEKIQVDVVYILVAPSIYAEKWGFSKRTALNTESETYWIEINFLQTSTSTAYAFAVERFRSHIPSFSYNGFHVLEKNQVDKAVNV
ncbi:hypothetical protein FRC07_011879 [Ceratobasidium sp. 392]|nr:hypothetical protein FRC07_011879 [Ceratobasidium sp. 392]